ncbi:MAG: hypothetical protein HIU83_15165 [Proteobacteria bacterium]|nr:hypothetical protein [Pseudomonadota bacterium]
MTTKTKPKRKQTPSMVLRDKTAKKAAANGRPIRDIKNKGTVKDCQNYLYHDVWSEAWSKTVRPVKIALPVDVSEIKPVKTALPVDIPTPVLVDHSLPLEHNKPEQIKCSLPVKAALPVAQPKTKQKAVLPNGRNRKSMPSFDQWHCQIFPKDITFPAWKYLTKTATDVANICRAKRDYSAAKNRKDASGIPIFDFSFGEAEKAFGMTRPTFSSAVKLLLKIGFIEYSCPGGIRNGVGVKAVYRLSDKWRTWEPPTRDNSNIDHAREVKNEIRSKKTKST